MVTVYRKSAKGQLEIETRVNKLHPRLRTVLILVDGRRNDDDLRALIQVDADATLLGLLEGGYIEVATGVPAAPANPASPGQRPAAPVAAAAPMAAKVAPAADAGGAAPAERRRQAVRYLTDRLGPLAETAALRIEKARNPDEERAALEHGQRLLQTARGSNAAAEFATLFLQSLSR